MSLSLNRPLWRSIESGAASATPPAALSGQHSKAPGFAGGYLPFHVGNKGSNSRRGSQCYQSLIRHPADRVSRAEACLPSGMWCWQRGRTGTVRGHASPGAARQFICSGTNGQTITGSVGVRAPKPSPAHDLSRARADRASGDRLFARSPASHARRRQRAAPALARRSG